MTLERYQVACLGFGMDMQDVSFRMAARSDVREMRSDRTLYVDR